MIIQSRRGFLAGVVGLLAAPAIVRATSIMPVKALPELLPPGEYVVEVASVQQQRTIHDVLRYVIQFTIRDPVQLQRIAWQKS